MASQQLTRRTRLELPGFVGLSAILSTSDLVATLPRPVGETLARATGPGSLRVLACPFDISRLCRQAVLAHPLSTRRRLALAERNLCCIVYEKWFRGRRYGRK